MKVAEVAVENKERLEGNRTREDQTCQYHLRRMARRRKRRKCWMETKRLEVLNAGNRVSMRLSCMVVFSSNGGEITLHLLSVNERRATSVDDLIAPPKYHEILPLSLLPGKPDLCSYFSRRVACYTKISTIFCLWPLC